MCPLENKSIPFSLCDMFKTIIALFPFMFLDLHAHSKYSEDGLD
jgi:hypothetical protein